MILPALALLKRLGEHPDTGVAAGRALQARPAWPVQVVTEAELAGLARSAFPHPSDPDGERWYGTTAAPQLLLALTCAAEIDLGATPVTLTGAHGAVYAATVAAVDDYVGGSHVLAAELYATLRAFARAVALPFARVPGARKAIAEAGVRFAAPEVLQYAARPSEPGSPLLTRTLLLTMAGADPFLAGGTPDGLPLA